MQHKGGDPTSSVTENVESSAKNQPVDYYELFLLIPEQIVIVVFISNLLAGLYCGGRDCLGLGLIISFA